MNSISAVNSMSKYNHLNNSLPQPESAPVSSPTFKGAKTKQLMGGLTILGTTILAGLGIKKSGPKTIPTESIKEALEKASQNNPELIEGLRDNSHFAQISRDDEGIFCDYSDTNILAIYEANKEDPKFAYELAKILQCNEGLQYANKAETDYLVQKLKTEPETVKNMYYPGSPKKTTLKLKAYDKDPKSAEELLNIKVNDIQRYDISDVVKLQDTYLKYPNQVYELSLMETPEHDNALYVENIISLAPKYDENKENIKTLVANGITGNQVEKLLEAYKINPELVLKYRDKLYFRSREEVAAFVETVANAGEYINFDKGNFKDVIDFANKAKSNEKYYRMITEENPEIEMTYENMQRINKLEDEDKEQISRIIQDGRGKTLDDIISLIPIYKKRPNVKITEAMINHDRDPLAKLFDIE